MSSNFERYKADIKRLEAMGRRLTFALQHEVSPKTKSGLSDKEIEELPLVRSSYELWYSEALALINQLLPDRSKDFTSYYKPQGPRKEILYSTCYTISDYLRGTTITRAGDVIVGPSAALAPMHQQANIVKTLLQRFDSTLFDIRTLVHADLLDDELAAADELNSKGFQRGAGAIAGVVLEGHLSAVCERHLLKSGKKDPSISDLNDTLKSASIIETSTWRFIQHLGDLRNKCDHKKSEEPTKQDIVELIEGVKKITKTVF